MSRYRKIDPRFWKDEKVMNLSPEEKLIALYLFTGQSNRIGLFNFSPGEAAEDLGLNETFREGFGKVCERLNFGWDKTFRVLYIPTWWKYNCPENPNVLKACLADLHEIPKTPLLAEFSSNLEFLPETFHETFRKGFGKPSPKRMPDQEQEQEQEQKQDNKAGAGAPQRVSRSSGRKTRTIPPEIQPTVAKIVERMNELAGTSYRPDSKIVLNGLVPRLAANSEQDCIAVVEDRWREWGAKPEMRQYFNPETLFRESNFEKYLNATKIRSRGILNGSAAVRELPA